MYATCLFLVLCWTLLIITLLNLNVVICLYLVLSKLDFIYVGKLDYAIIWLGKGYSTTFISIMKTKLIARCQYDMSLLMNIAGGVATWHTIKTYNTVDMGSNTTTIFKQRRHIGGARCPRQQGLFYHAIARHFCTSVTVVERISIVMEGNIGRGSGLKQEEG